MVKKISAILLLIAMITSNSINVLAADMPEVTAESGWEFEVTPEELQTGITVVVTRDSEGNYVSAKYDDASQVPMPCLDNLEDGLIEIAIMHVGVRNWSGSKCSIYLTYECDEPTKSLGGNFYLKKPGLIAAPTYWSGDVSFNMFNCTSTTRYVKQNIEIGDATRIKVGYKNVTFIATSGDDGYFADGDKIVTPDDMVY